MLYVKLITIVLGIASGKEEREEIFPGISNPSRNIALSVDLELYCSVKCYYQC